MTANGEFEASRLNEAEFLLLAGGIAVAVAHRPGSAPWIVEAAAPEAAGGLLWRAVAVGLPILEVEGLRVEQQEAFLAGGKVPEDLFDVVADCLGVLQRQPSEPVQVRLVRLPERPPAEVVPQWEARAAELGEAWMPSALHVQVGEAVALRPLQDSLEQSRQRFELETGLLVPELRATVDPELKPRGYAVLVRGVEAARGDLPSDGGFRPLLEALSLEGRRRAWTLLGYRETEALVRNLRKSHEGLVAELFPSHLGVPTLRAVLRNLLREGLPIRDLPMILEAILECLSRARDPEALTEYVRSCFGYYLCAKHSDDQGVMWALLLHPEAEEAVQRGVRRGSTALWLEVDLESSLRLLASLAQALEKAMALAVPPVLLASPAVRPFLRRLVEPSFPDLPVLSYSEVVPLAEVRTFALVSLQSG